MDKLFRKALAAVSAAAIVATQALSAAVYAANDFNSLLQDAFNFAKQHGLTNASSVNDFDPFAQLSRGTAAKLFAIYGENVLGLQPDPTKDCNFTDVEGKWYAQYAVKACQLGLMKGNNGKFLGERKLMKSEAVVVLARALAGQTLEWNEAIRYAQQNGITNVQDVTKLYRPVTKWELVIMEKRVADKKAESQQNQQQEEQTQQDLGELLGNLLGGEEENQNQQEQQEETTSQQQEQNQQEQQEQNQEEQNQEEQQAVEGNVLEVALDPDTPREQYVPGTGSHIRVMKLDLTAGGEDVQVNAITLKLE